MDFYGFDNQNLKSPGQKFGCHAWVALVVAAAKQEFDAAMYYWNSPLTDIADINAKSQLAIARENNKTLGEITQLRTDAIIDQAELRSQGILATASLQYQQVKDQMRMIELTDKREHRNWRFQLRNDVKSLTLMASARLHADQLASVRNKTAMHYEHAARQVEGANTENS
ncbi:MAG: hypothetical protein HYT76_04965 [Deltaproteobacteria bacterium]|nr:hypothetical protein [Deltaproteobacteria bacterium]